MSSEDARTQLEDAMAEAWFMVKHPFTNESGAVRATDWAEDVPEVLKVGLRAQARAALRVVLEHRVPCETCDGTGALLRTVNRPAGPTNETPCLTCRGSGFGPPAVVLAMGATRVVHGHIASWHIPPDRVYPEPQEGQ